MIRKKLISILISSLAIFVTFSGITALGMDLDRNNQYIRLAFEYDDNVTRESLEKNSQSDIVWRLNSAFGVKNIIPIDKTSSHLKYILGMRDVNATNKEDFNSHDLNFEFGINPKQETRVAISDAFKIWNSQNDLFNYIDNLFEVKFDQGLGRNTTTNLSYKNEQKWFQNKAPEVRARNYFYHQISIGVNHSISDDFTVQLGYAEQFRYYNRSPIIFESGRPIALDGVQMDRQKFVILGFYAIILKNASLMLSDQIISSDSNSDGFDFDGNKMLIILSINPIRKLSIGLSYQLAAYNLGAYQTPDLGYELSETRTDDQSFVRFGISYKLSDQVLLRFNYEHIDSTIFFTKNSYKVDTASLGMEVRF